MQSCIVPVLLNINSNETIASIVALYGKTLAIQGGTCMCSLSSSQSWLYRLSTHDITHVIKLSTRPFHIASDGKLGWGLDAGTIDSTVLGLHITLTTPFRNTVNVLF